MKKGLIWIIVTVALALCIAIAGIVGFSSCNRSSVSVGENNTVSKVEGLKDKYTVGKSIYFSVLITSDVELKNVTYTLNNGSETLLEAETGLNADRGEDKLGTGKYYIDTGIQVIDTSSMPAGYYVFVLRATNEAGTSYLIGEPIVIRLDAAAAQQPAAA